MAIPNDMRKLRGWLSVAIFLGFVFAEPVPVLSSTIVPAGPGTTSLFGPGKGHWRVYGADVGLNGVFHAVAQDSAGNMWFGDNGAGVIRYDGVSRTIFTTDDGLAHRVVRSIYTDRDGAVWVGTFGGISRYDGEEWVTYRAGDGLDSVYVITQDDSGTMWFGTGGGLRKFDGRQWSNAARNDTIYSIFRDADGSTWLGTQRGAIREEDGDEQRWLEGRTVYAILRDSKSMLWFGTDAGLHRYDGHTERDVVFEELPIFSLCEDVAGDLWFAHWDGAGRFDGRRFIEAEELMGVTVFALMVDREGSMWFGTNQGAAWYGGRSLVSYGVEDGMPNSFSNAYYQEEDGRLWFGSPQGGVAFVDGDSITVFTAADGLVDDRVMHISGDSRGNVWLATGAVGGKGGLFAEGGSGAIRYDGESFETYTTEDGLAWNWVASVLEDRSGNMWFGTLKGVSRYDGQSFRNFTAEDGLAGSFFSRLNRDRETGFWVSSFEGASHFDGQTWATYTAEDGLASDWVYRVLRDRHGALWFATSHGVNRYDEEGFTTYTAEDGLASDWAYGVWEDRRGRLWFGTISGASCYDGRVFQSLTRQDGLPADGVVTFYEDQEGDIWLGWSRGATRYRPPRPSPPPIYIDAVVADERYAGAGELSLPSGVGLVAFEFHGVSFKTRPGGMVYRYRLKGHDEEWRNTRETRVEYKDLPGGDYTFEVLAVDRDMTYSEEPATMRLTVQMPFMQIGLISALIVALSLAGWQTVRVVRRGRELRNSNAALSDANKELFGVNQDLQQKSEDLEKSKVAAESANHAKSLFLANMSHEIRTPMNAILGYAQILQRSDDLGANHRHAVETIGQSGYHLLNLINDVLDISKIEAGRMELAPEDFDLADLVRGLSVMFELQCKEKGLGWRLEGLDEEKLPVHGDEAKVRQVLINLIGNGVKFTTEGEVVLRLMRGEGDGYRFEVADTGPGMSEEDREALFQPFQQGESGMRQGGTGLGLTISQRQLGLMGSELEVESTVGEGSCFSFAIELPPAREEVVEEEVESWSRVTGLAPGNRVRALVADDVAENREILSSMLSGIGVEVEVVENGKEALERMEASLPDVVFLDIRMPVLDGLETLELVQEDERWRQVKVVAVSASVLEHEQAEFLQAGFDDFLDKPFRFEDVCGCLAQHLGVEFVYGEGGEEAIGGAGDWQGISLPEELVSGLVKAAEFYSVTEIEGFLQEMEGLGEGERRLASHLRELRRQHDMEGIVEMLRSIDNN